MEGTLFGYLGKYTVVSLLLSYLAIMLSKLAFPLNYEIGLEIFRSNAIILVFAFVLLILYVMIYSAMVEKYEDVLRICFRKPMLRYTVAKKQYEKGNYEIEGKPRKNYDSLPQGIKTEIDKLDSSLYNQKIPKLLDLSIASFNSVMLLAYGFFAKNYIFLIIVVFSIYFIYFLRETYLDIKNTILKDYMSLFEE